jgi:hypothetical protein
MASQVDTDEPPASPGRRIGCWASLAMLLVLAIGLAFVWFSRERIAGNVFADELAKRGIEASYTIEEIGPRRQVLRDIVIGDPGDPDLTIERAEVVIRYRLGFPTVASLRLLRPRLRASYRDGTLSFGALDPLIFGEEEAPFELPDLRLIVEQGRGLLESDYGPVGISLNGSGHLRNGFSAELAATAPRLAGEGCQAERATLYGRLSVDARRPDSRGRCAWRGWPVRRRGSRWPTPRCSWTVARTGR